MKTKMLINTSGIRNYEGAICCEKCNANIEREDASIFIGVQEGVDRYREYYQCAHCKNIFVMVWSK